MPSNNWRSLPPNGIPNTARSASSGAGIGNRLCPSFFAFPADIRKVIYTTNAVESLNMTLRKVIKTRGSFPNEDAAIKLLYLALMNVAKKWRTLQGWPQALNHFAILWGDRFPERPR